MSTFVSMDLNSKTEEFDVYLLHRADHVRSIDRSWLGEDEDPPAGRYVTARGDDVEAERCRDGPKYRRLGDDWRRRLAFRVARIPGD